MAIDSEMLQPQDSGPLEGHLEHYLITSDTTIYERLARPACILFCDLVGSTEFKRDHGPKEGLAKVYMHNKVASSAIKECSGRVVKYLGDGVMGMFAGEHAAKDAITAGLRIISNIHNTNEKFQWHFPSAMSTRVGVDWGDVWPLKYPEGPAEDPQGTTVDIAARLTKIAGPQQLVCKEETYQRAGGQEVFPNATQGIKRFLKGINPPVILRVLAPLGKKAESIPLRPFLSPLEQELHAGVRLRREKNHPEALRKFREVIEKENGNFFANLYVAEILLRDIVAVASGSEEKKLTEAQDCLCRAKWERPASSHVCLLFSWLRFKQFELTNDNEFLEKAIRSARESIDAAELELDLLDTVQAKTGLAHYLWTRFRRANRNPPEDLDEARKLCGEVAIVTDAMLGRCRVEYLVTHAFVRLDSGDPDFPDIEKMIEEALAIEPYHLRAAEAKTELIRRAHYRPGSTLPLIL
jgi:class 3 adenylate cyclase